MFGFDSLAKLQLVGVHLPNCEIDYLVRLGKTTNSHAMRKRYLKNLALIGYDLTTGSAVRWLAQSDRRNIG